MPRIRWALVAVLGGLVALPATASAVPAPEPNDGIHQAKGPLVAGTNYTANIASNHEDDWFLVYLSSAGTLKVDVTNSTVQNCYPNLYASINDRDGFVVKDAAVGTGTAKSLSLTTSAGGSYYVRFTASGDTNCGGNYSFKATGPIVGGPLPGAAAATANTGRDPASAIGPLEGAKLYGARTDSSWEADWFFFYTSGGGEFDVTITNTMVNNAPDCYVGADLYPGATDDDLLDSASGVIGNTRGHLTYDGAGAARYSVVVGSGCAQNGYQLVVAPKALVTADAPPDPPPPPPPDADADGFPDDADRCPTQPGVEPDGCPLPPDTDRDGIRDPSDRCRTTPGMPPDGCPPPDRDADGVPDASDRCPSVNASTADGCKPPAQQSGGIASLCADARATRREAKAELNAARARVRSARTRRGRRLARRSRARRRALYIAAKANARRLCA
jgi:hypothetical protein